MPSMRWITSTQRGGLPKRAIVSPSAKSSTVNWVRGAKLGESFVGRQCVRGRGFDQHIEVFRRSGLSVNEDGVSVHYDILNAVRVEGDEQPF